MKDRILIITVRVSGLTRTPAQRANPRSRAARGNDTGNGPPQPRPCPSVRYVMKRRPVAPAASPRRRYTALKNHHRPCGPRRISRLASRAGRTMRMQRPPDCGSRRGSRRPWPRAGLIEKTLAAQLRGTSRRGAAWLDCSTALRTGDGSLASCPWHKNTLRFEGLDHGLG